MNFRNRKVVIITGAGATRSEAAADIPDKDKPPLDKGFFANAEKAESGEYYFVRKYMKRHYGIDPAGIRHDSLENVMSIIYSDAVNPARVVSEDEADIVLRNLFLLPLQRIEATTNNLPVAPKKSNLGGIVSGVLTRGCQPQNLNVVTFNYDLHAEKVLQYAQKRAGRGAQSRVFSFHHCYQLPQELCVDTKPRGGREFFDVDKRDRGGVRVLKLHGSLNWRSMYESPPSAQEMLEPEISRLRITPRMQVKNDMKIYRGEKPYYTYPLIIPPVAHKAGILRSVLVNVWAQARDALREATDVVIFGYSCPPQDVESANLISGGFHRNRSARVSVIDPSSATFRRYIDLTGLDSLRFYKNAREFIKDTL